MLPAATRAPRFIALVVFVLLAVVHTWPLARDPVHQSRNDSSDALLNTWAIAWVAHQLPRDPAHLFDANIFAPERHTLGYSEAMIVQGVLAMPILAAGGSPTLAYNLVLIAGFVFTGWAFFLLLQAWTGSLAAGYVAGSLAAFNAHSLVRLTHLQAQHVEFIPITLFALDRIVKARRVRDAIWLAIGFALQALTSVYLLVFSTWMLIFAALGRSRESFRQSPMAVVGLLVLAGAIATALLFPYLSAYYTLHATTGFARRADEATFFAASWANFLSTPGRLHYSAWSAPYMRTATSSTFPGLVATLLAVTAMVWRDTRRDPRVQMCLTALAGCLVISILPRLPAYSVLHDRIPLFSAVRVPAHMGQVVLLLLAVVAGFAVAGLQRRWGATRQWAAIAVGLVLLVNLEALRAPVGYTADEGISGIYDELGAMDTGAVAEFPFPQPTMGALNAPYMLNSTRHWWPLLNGYSGFQPASYRDTYDAINHFPDDASLIALHTRGVTHVVVHFKAQFNERSVGKDTFDAIERSASLHRVAQRGDIYIYRLK